VTHIGQHGPPGCLKPLVLHGKHRQKYRFWIFAQNARFFRLCIWCLVSTNNTIKASGSCHWFDGVTEVIFENNACDGASLVSEGSNVGTYGAAVAQHVYKSCTVIDSRMTGALTVRS
jgi:hypothetical protein